MGKSREEVKQIRARLEEEYSKPPYDEYVRGFLTSSLNAQKMIGNKFALKPGESLADLCIGVSLKKEPSKDLIFYHEFEGVKVFYEKAIRYSARPAKPSEGE